MTFRVKYINKDWKEVTVDDYWYRYRTFAFRNYGDCERLEEIELVDGAYDTEGGCLSLLGGPRKCKRYKTIKVQYQTLDMQMRTKNFTGWTAQIIQHEVDHCNGDINLIPSH